MVEQSQRREWRKRRRRRKRVRLLLKILIFSVIFCSIGYGGKSLYGKYVAKALRDNPASETPNTEDPADNTEETNTSDQTPATDLPENSDTTVNEDLNENPEETQKPDPSMKPEEPERSDSSEKSDGTDKPDPTSKPEKENPKPSEKPKKEEKPTPSKKPDEDPDTGEQSEEASDDENSEEDTEKVDDSYFNDAVFVGDSRTEGFGMYSGLKKATFYSEKGLTVDSIFKDKAVKINGKKVTIMDALKSHSFGKVYIMLGVNELGWPYEEVFLKQYKKIIDEIKEAQPDAIIYIQSIIHVSKEKDKNPPSYITNKRINSRNKALKKMAEKEDVNYLNVNEVLTDKSGSLFEKAATDGVHLNQKYCLIWKDYLLKHTVN